MIDLGTLGGLHQHHHELAAYCPQCDRWHVLPLAEMVAAGADTRVGLVDGDAPMRNPGAGPGLFQGLASIAQQAVGQRMLVQYPIVPSLPLQPSPL